MGGEEKSPAGLSSGEKKREERKEEEKQRKERERERKKKIGCSSSDLQHSDGRNSSDHEVKSVYLTRTMLQEIEILPTWFISSLRAIWSCFGTVGKVALYTV